MADNTTTYKAVIETEVKGQDKVDDLNDSIDKGGEKFVSLRRQIRETTVQLQELADKGKEGTKEFKQLSDQLDDLQDQQKRVAFQSGQIEDKLAALPGPIGNIGKGFASAKEAVDTFGTGLAVATGGITLIIGAIVAMKDAMSKTKEGQETLNKVTQAFSKILAPLFALFENIGIPIFNKVAQVLGWVGDKITWVLEKLGISSAKIQEVYNNIDEVGKKQAEDEKKRNEELAKSAKEAADKKKEAHEKWVQKQKELEAERLANEKWALEQELKAFEENQKRIDALRKKGALDPIGPDGMTKKERDAALAAKKKQEEDAEKQRIADSEKIYKTYLANRTQLGMGALYKEAEEKAKVVKKESELDKWLNSEKKKRLDEGLAATKAALNIAGGLVDEGSNAAKAISIAQTTIDTYQSATAAYKSLAGIPVVGPALGIAAAAAAIAAGIANVNKIVSTKVPKMSTGGGGGESGEGANISAPAIQAPTLPSLAFNDSTLGIAGGTNPTAQIANTLAQTTGKPIKAYVVSTEMSSHQALDRRTNVAATF